MMPVKVAIISHHVCKNDGQGRVNFELTRYLAGQGHEIHLVAHSVSEELPGWGKITAHLLPNPVERPNVVKSMVFIRQAGKFVAAGNFDFVHANGGVLLGPHHLNTSHFVHNWWKRFPHGSCKEGVYLRFATSLYAHLEKKAYAAAKIVVAVSHKVKRELVHYAGVDEEKIRVIYNGIDGDEFSPVNRSGARREVLARWRIPPGRLLLLFAGDLRNDRKGISTVLEALHLLKADGHLLVLGDASGSPYVRQAEKMGLGDRITWAGFQKGINHYMRAADVFVYPTRTDSFPTVVMEALSSGTPVVVPGSEYCGVSELLRDYHNAMLISSPWSAADLAERVDLLAAGKNLWQKLSYAGRKLTEQMTWQAMAKNYEQVYLELMRY